MSARSRASWAVLLVGYLLFLGFVLGQADPTLATSVVARCAAWLDLVGAPDSVTTASRVELVINAAMFVPVALLAALTFPRHHWADWVVYGFVGSVLVEAVQGLALPLRSAQFADVVANTGGMLAGALLSCVVLRHSAARAADLERLDSGPPVKG